MRILTILLVLVLIACEYDLPDKYISNDTAYSVFGKVTAQKGEVVISKNYKINETIELNKQNLVTNAVVSLVDSKGHTVANLVYNNTTNSYIASLPVADSTSQLKLIIKGPFNAESSLITPIPKIKLNSFNLIDSTQDYKDYTIGLRWIHNKVGVLRFYQRDTVLGYGQIEILNFNESSQCTNNAIDGSLLLSGCLNSNLDHELKIRVFKGNSSLPILNITAFGKEYLDFISSIFFFEDFGRIFVEQGVIKSNIKGTNVSGYFSGSSEFEIDLR